MAAQPAPGTRPRAFRRIVVGTDFTPASKRAFRKGLELARDLGAELHLLHVACTPHTRAVFFISIPPESRRLICERLKHKAQRRIADFLRGEDTEGVDLRRVVGEGKPCAELVGYAEREGADLLVVGENHETRAQHLLQHLAFESVGERVRRAARCPVLTVR
ncbi:MAG: universal stress protein [Deferrisomatales bacterium]